MSGEWVVITAAALEAVEYEKHPLNHGDVLEQPEPVDEAEQQPD